MHFILISKCENYKTIGTGRTSNLPFKVNLARTDGRFNYYMLGGIHIVLTKGMSFKQKIYSFFYSIYQFLCNFKISRLKSRNNETNRPNRIANIQNYFKNSLNTAHVLRSSDIFSAQIPVQ
jgi:hypothetical protein